MLLSMTDLDPETKARIEAEERYRADLRGEQPGFSISMALGLLGGVLLVLGAFLPVATIPIVGSVSLFGRGLGDGLILLALGVIVIIVSFIPRARLVLTGVGLLALLTGLLDYKSLHNLQGGEYGGMIQLQIGWAVIVLGVIFTLIAPILYRQN